MLPKHGVVYAVYLLVHAAMVAPRRSLKEWTQAARLRSSFLSEATDLCTPAEQLVDCGLVKLDEWIEVSPQLMSLIGQDRSVAFRDIAQLLLLASPPYWLRFAVHDSGVAREYIPNLDLASLEWLDPNLDEMLMLARARQKRADASLILADLGRIGELFVLAALRRHGAAATHVSLFSDAFGYDIDVSRPERHRLEVKAAGPKTAGQFHITRNEFAASRRYREEWLLIQIVFNSAAFVAHELTVEHVQSVKTLESSKIAIIIPDDTPHFTWEGSAKITVPTELWTIADLDLDQNFKAQWQVPTI